MDKATFKYYISKLIGLFSYIFHSNIIKFFNILIGIKYKNPIII